MIMRQRPVFKRLLAMPMLALMVALAAIAGGPSEAQTPLDAKALMSALRAGGPHGATAVRLLRTYAE